MAPTGFRTILISTLSVFRSVPFNYTHVASSNLPSWCHFGISTWTYNTIEILFFWGGEQVHITKGYVFIIKYVHITRKWMVTFGLVWCVSRCRQSKPPPAEVGMDTLHAAADILQPGAEMCQPNSSIPYEKPEFYKQLHLQTFEDILGTHY